MRIHRKFTLIPVALLLLMLTGCGPKQFKTNLFLPFESAPSAGPTAMAYNGQDIILANSNQIVFSRNVRLRPMSDVHLKLEPAHYSEEGRFPPQLYGGAFICGMTWENNCCRPGALWMADAAGGVILKFSGQRNPVAALPCPGTAPSGLGFDGENLWLADHDEGVIRKIDPQSGRTLRVVRSPIRHPTGLVWECGYLWVVGMDNCGRTPRDCLNPRLVRMDFGLSVTKFEIKLPDAVHQPAALTWFDGHIWVGDRVTNRVFRFSTEKMQKIDPVHIETIS